MKRNILLFLLCLYPLITISYSQEGNDRQQLHHKTENDVIKQCIASETMEPYKEFLNKKSDEAIGKEGNEALQEALVWYATGFQKRLTLVGQDMYDFVDNEKGDDGKYINKYPIASYIGNFLTTRKILVFFSDNLLPGGDVLANAKWDGGGNATILNEGETNERKVRLYGRLWIHSDYRDSMAAIIPFIAHEIGHGIVQEWRHSGIINRYTESTSIEEDFCYYLQAMALYELGLINDSHIITNPPSWAFSAYRLTSRSLESIKKFMGGKYLRLGDLIDGASFQRAISGKNNYVIEYKKADSKKPITCGSKCTTKEGSCEIRLRMPPCHWHR